MQMKKLYYFYSLLLILHSAFSFSQELKRIKHFGKNKGHLKMYLHVPGNIDTIKSSPLVVVLHGCLQCADKVQKQSGWSKLGDENSFYVLYPQQRRINNPERCFRWYKRKHTNKNKGENYSIKQMIEYTKSHYKIDSNKIFITGLSAGAAMGVIMMTDYPQTFNAGAIFAGGAYKSGNGMVAGLMAMLVWRIKTSEKWGDIARKQNPEYKGKYPRIMIYQGNRDWVVNKRNGVELMKQWTNLHHIESIPSEIIDGYVQVKDIQRLAYHSPNQKEAVVFYKINKLGHALLVDPGKCQFQGGRRGVFSKDKNYFSTLWTAYDFGLITIPEIIGPKTATKNQTISFYAEKKEGVKYDWSFPADCVVEEIDGHFIRLKWGNENGSINLIETDLFNCKKPYKTLFVKIKKE